MKISMQLTLDGLVRAMRVKAHKEADAVEGGQRKNIDSPATRRREALRRISARRQGGRHDSSRT